MMERTMRPDLDFDLLLTATRDGLRRAAISDPTAAQELALDLSEIAMLERGRKEDEPLRAGPAIMRAARAMANLRCRFNPVPALGSSKETPEDSPVDEHWKPYVDQNGEQGYDFDEVGVWMLVLPRFEEMKKFKGDPELTSFRAWLYAWSEQILTGNGGGR
jgi:hypothetical protein